MMVGLMAIYSATAQNFRVSQKLFYDQLMGVGVSLVIMYALRRIDYRKLYDIAYFSYGATILLLIFVLVSGRHALGATRWIQVGGISFQPSELMKIALILALARYFSNRRPNLSFDFSSTSRLFWRDFIVPFLMMMAAMILIFKQPDLGTSLLMLGIFLAMIFVNGIDYKYLIGFFGVSLAVLPIAWKLMRQYQKDRLLVFLNPNIDPLGAGYTIIQSKIAVGSGQIFGKGWLSGTQNQLNFLPERHTDFIFSVVGEEWGLIGSLFVVACYFILIQVCLSIVEQIKDRFGLLVAVGIISILTIQVIINIGMVMGIFPVVGITLPFMSYGRTSLLVFALMMGFMLNLSKKGGVSQS
jgi:rod shape determining protein RodA